MAFMCRFGSALRQVARGYDACQLRTAGAAAYSMPAVHLLSRGMASSKLFVGGLAWGADESELREAFSSYGEVIDVKIITDRDTGRSRGFGFVSFTNDEDAESALQAMDGRTLAGRAIRVDYAVQKPAGYGRGLGGSMGGGLTGLGGMLGSLGGENVKRDEFGFPIKDNTESNVNTTGDSNVDSNDARLFESHDGEKDKFGSNGNETSSLGRWKNL